MSRYGQITFHVQLGGLGYVLKDDVLSIFAFEEDRVWVDEYRFLQQAARVGVFHLLLFVEVHVSIPHVRQFPAKARNSA